MTIARGALWAGDLTRISCDEPGTPGYVLIEARAAWLLDEVAKVAGPAPVVRERVERGCRVWVAWAMDADEVAAWLWISTGSEWAPPLRHMLELGDDCYGWDADTLPGHRGHGLFTGLLLAAGRRMAGEGHRLMWGGILDENVASQRANAAAGLRPVLHVVAVHDPAPTVLRTRRVEYADRRLADQARRLLA